MGDQVHALALGVLETALVEEEGETGRLEDREADGEVARPLRHLLEPDLALFLPGLELGDHDRQELHDDRRGDVGHDPEGEHRELGECAAGEEVEQAEHAAVDARQAPGRLDVDPGHRYVGAQAVDGDDEQREQQLFAKVRNLESVDER